MEIRQAFPNEIGAIMTVIESARIALAEAGSSQWQGADGYPTEEIIFDDVLKGQAYVGIIDGQIVSYAAVVTDEMCIRDRPKPYFQRVLLMIRPFTHQNQPLKTLKSIIT